MANEEHLAILRQGVESWNQWREESPEVRPDLSEADLREADLNGADLSKAHLRRVFLSKAILSRVNLRQAYLMDGDLYEVDLTLAHLSEADLSGAFLIAVNLQGADLWRVKLLNAKLNDANLSGAYLSEANLTGADLSGAHLSKVVLSEARLVGANLSGAQLINTYLEKADITGCCVYGISAWDLILDGTIQANLVITPEGEPVVTVDDLEVAQFIYLLLNRRKLRNVIDTITSKAVLILGRFTPDRKPVLDAMADELRKHNLLPIIFDFERSTSRDFTETIKILAGMSLFVIADITNPKSSPLELQATVPDYQIPFVPIIQEGEELFSMFNDLWGKYDWVLQPVKYPSLPVLQQVFKEAILDRAWEKHKELEQRKAQRMQVLSAEEFLAEN